MKLIQSALFSCCLIGIADAHSFALENLTWHVLSTKLPSPVSDMTATFAPNDLIYIAGGCDSPDGNVYNNATGFFECGSISKTFYSFHPDTYEIVMLPDMPIARYRHSAGATSDNKIWIAGGRNLTDSLVLQIDVSPIFTLLLLSYPSHLVLSLDLRHCLGYVVYARSTPNRVQHLRQCWIHQGYDFLRRWWLQRWLHRQDECNRF